MKKGSAERSQRAVQMTLKRDAYRCRRCHSQSSVEVHHVIAIQDAGLDTAENCIALCAECHKEWHLAETIITITFGEWMQLPTYRRSVAFWKAYLDTPFDDMKCMDMSTFASILFAQE